MVRLKEDKSLLFFFPGTGKASSHGSCYLLFSGRKEIRDALLKSAVFQVPLAQSKSLFMSKGSIWG